MGLFATKEVQFAVEASHAQYAGDPGSATWTKRIPVLDVRHNFTQERRSDGSIQSRQNESRPGYLMPREGTLEIDFLLGGHMATTASGALTGTWIYTLLKAALGGGNVASVGGLAASGATTTSLPFTAATCVRGGLVRVGAANDARAEGHFYQVGAQATTPLTLLNAMAGAPSLNDVIYAPQMVYPTQTGHDTVRFLLGNDTTAAQWMAFGCQAENISFKFVFGDIIVVTIRYTCSYWHQSTVAIPSATAMEDCKAAIMAGGSVAFQTVGTTTRNVESPFEFGISLDMGLARKPGPGGQPYQVNQGYERTRCIPTLSMTVEWADKWRTLFDTDGSDTTHKYCLITCNRADGTAIGIWMPRLYPVGSRPVHSDFNGLLAHQVTFQGREGTDTTNDLTRAPILLAMA